MSFELFVDNKFRKEFHRLVKDNKKVLDFQSILFDQIKFYFIEAHKNKQDIGDRIASTGNDKFEIHKIRFILPGSKKGKRSGLRVICYIYNQDSFWLLSIYEKKENFGKVLDTKNMFWM